MPKKITPRHNDGDVVVGRVAIYRVIDIDGAMRDDIYTDDGRGGDLDPLTAISMCAMGQHRIFASDFEETGEREDG
jgi:hypothetical protein